MSKNSEAKTETKAEMEQRLESALQRVVSLEQQKLIPQMDHLRLLANQKEQILAAQILARKEMHCPARGDRDATDIPEKTELHMAVDERHGALLNHRTIRDAMQSAALNIKLQEAVRDGLQRVDVEDTMDHFQDRGVLLAHCGNNLHACKELASVVEKKTNLDREILQLHLKYSTILKEIKQKWEVLQDRVMQVQEDSKALAQLREKARERENKVHLLVTMIQGLISTGGFQWGAYEYFVQVKLLCDSVIMHQDTAKQDAIMKEISAIREERENKENQGTLREMMSARKPVR